MRLDGPILNLDTEEEYREALDCLQEWMTEGDKPAPPYVENLIQAIVNYEAKHFPIEWDENED